MYLTEDQRKEVKDDPSKLMDLLADVVNCNSATGAMAKGISRQHRTLQANIITFCLQTIAECAKDRYPDGRNQAAVNRCQNIVADQQCREGEPATFMSDGTPWWTNVKAY